MFVTTTPSDGPYSPDSLNARDAHSPTQERKLPTMMYSCAPATGGSRSIVRTKRKGSLRVDIHCHYLNTEVAARVAGQTPPEADYLAKFSNELTRETNARQGRDRAAKLSDIDLRLKEMDRMGID